MYAFSFIPRIGEEIRTQWKESFLEGDLEWKWFAAGGKWLTILPTSFLLKFSLLKLSLGLKNDVGLVTPITI